MQVKAKYTVIFWGNKNHPTELVMQLRNPKRAYAPGFRSGTGGHFEPDKDKSMIASAHRELAEEVPDLANCKLINFARCYVTTNLRDGTTALKIFYYYWGGVLPKNKPLPPCDPEEGILEWVPVTDLANKNVFPVTLEILEEWKRQKFNPYVCWTKYFHGTEDENGITRQVYTQTSPLPL